VIVVAAFVAGALAALALWRLTAAAFAVLVFARENFRKRVLPTSVGLLIALVALAVDAGVALAEAAGADADLEAVHGLRLVTLAALGFGLLGLLDDLAGEGQSGGFRGHLRGLATGNLTTGAVKLFGGAAVAIVVVSLTGRPGIARLLADAALVALAANLGNLFDRAPGRTTKVALVAFAVVVVAAGAEPVLAGVALAVGAGAGLLPGDLAERLMLGDAGANVLGAVLGLAVVLVGSPTTRTVVLIVVAALNLASERVSFSRVIDRTAPLRAADRWGRRP
jgi:UDP-N-acetylmuramyl pentapeptide phosphotransferase/UDP-N-acetylglucosamine-1-phosphate transferase